ncbi:hypothetical protein GGX14DRAFT_385797 [Mycena pura]|uniref:Uncharacterized protein n=1 Tax=Mycena pura TaxID=153505 RepID=A0AAD6UU82_9AGAR|nr:hypothetical protein GGX14DRAFT_404356 [Mycena pura]KAJ7227024.1 hypothetical protein GGX14DRAFT_385797 [Mycena pura]
MRQNKLDPALVSRILGDEIVLSHKVNAIGLAVIRKCIEIWGVEELAVQLRRLHGLSMCMGTRGTDAKYGQIVASYGVKNVKTEIPGREQQRHLRRYHDALLTYFKRTGDSFTVQNPGALGRVQTEEQTFHDWILRYHEGRARPLWALEPLPTLARICAAPVQLAPVLLAPPTRARARAPHPIISSSHARNHVDVIDISDDEAPSQPDPAHFLKRKRSIEYRPLTPPPSSPIRTAGVVIDLTSPVAIAAPRKIVRKRNIVKIDTNVIELE